MQILFFLTNTNKIVKAENIVIVHGTNEIIIIGKEFENKKVSMINQSTQLFLIFMK